MNRTPPAAIRLKLLPVGLACFLTACSSMLGGAGGGTVTITRTTHGIPHITAPDMETLAYGVAYAHAQDNVCQTADHLVTVRGQRSLHFGEAGTGIMGVRTLPNPVIDIFVAAHMDDTALAKLWSASSAVNQAQARGYVAGYNRFLQDHAGRLPAACNGQPWVQPMTLADFFRATEVVQVQAGAGALADAIAANPVLAVQGTKQVLNTVERLGGDRRRRVLRARGRDGRPPALPRRRRRADPLEQVVLEQDPARRLRRARERRRLLRRGRRAPGRL